MSDVEVLLLICAEPEAPSDTEKEGDIEAWVAEVDRRGAGLAGDRLRPPEAATTVRFRDGRVLLSDGPFADTRETVVGFDLLQVAHLDEAIELAAAHPMARAGLIEIRPVWPLDLKEST